ncbi:putative nuclease HARBI1 [Teleopsis dalmanni]|uniref:putative nuclease HARBI1 n=1 Tax=Teleopsis dalmanni TaxID=139649 RepID=UPI0018CE2F12|nr:putative nuclease HARBI1 [Teleopsis dalmanni]XP_037929093.1 putative nuclease HARBI1 [Teleopsis dalmanni]XP_037957959.1 putative nuclease HARBI1 [Teleopsis dalmanni]
MATCKAVQAILKVNKLAALLRFIAQGSYQLGIGNEGIVGMAQSTLSVIINEVLNALESTICPKYVSFINTGAETCATKLYFYEKCGIPGIIGAIDGTHIKIVSLKNTQHLYFCRKGYHSINAMIVSIYELMFEHMPN